MKVRKLLALLFSLVMLLSLLSAMALASEKNGSGAKNGNYESYAQETVQGSAILHCFNWSYNEIREALPDIAAAGYTAVQTSPVQQPKDYDPTQTDAAGQWQNLYQPLGLRIAPTVDDAATSWLGTKAELTALCTEAENYGIKVIVDIVANHLANNGESGGTFSHLNAAVDSGLKNANFYHSITAAVNDISRHNLTQYHLGMPDLNTADTIVQLKVTGLLEECLDCGVDGFRFDAAKHIELPTDPSNCKSDFWPNVINDVRSYAENNYGYENDDLFLYGEVLGSVGGNMPASAYTTYMAVTDNESSDSARSSVLGLDAASLADGTYIKGADASDSILWAESHNDYMDGVTSGVSDDVIVKTWAIVGARADSTALFLARPNEVMGAASSDLSWKSTAVAEVNKFKNHFNGEGEALSYDQNAKVAWIERGTSGVVIAKLDGAGAVSLTASQMADGVYTDQVSKGRFTVSGGVITGTVGETGVAVVYNPNGTPDPIIASGETGEVSWRLEDGVLTISGTGAMADYASFRDVPWYDLGVTSAVIEDGVTNIGANAFRSCIAMESVSIGSDVTSIGSCAFLGCSALTGVTFPASVTSIGNNAFTACTGLTTVTVPATVQTFGDNAFLSCTGLTEATVGAESIGKYAFCDCWALTTLTLSDSVKSIGIEAFESCRSLKNLSLSSALETIGANAFSGCSGLESLTLPASVTSLGYSAFYNCGYLKTFTAECFLTSVDSYTFGGCSKLETLNFAGGVKTVGAAAFNNFTSLETVVFGEGTETIEQSAFLGCGALTSVTIPDTVTSIGPDAFRQCSKLERLTLPDSLTSIGYNTFCQCYLLRSVVLGNSVETIDDCAFFACSRLESITLPDSLTSIGYGTFQGCSALTSLHIPAGVTSIGNSAFEGCRNLAYLCSTAPDGAAAAYCTDNNLSFRLCGMHVTLSEVTGGTVTVNAPEHLTQGETVTLTATPDVSYYVPVWTVTDANGDPVTVTNNSFLMPGSDVSVSAVFGVPYLDETGTLQMLTEPVTFLTAETAADPVSGWVLVLEDLTLSQRLTVSGDAQLLLYDGATLTAPQGVEVPEETSLTIYAQSTGESMGALVAEVSTYSTTAIGADHAGTITINGGRIVAHGGDNAAGIGSRWSSTYGGLITINGGNITAESGRNCAAVNVATAGFVMNGGTLNATGAGYGAGIGAGYMNTCGPITINGGVINADSEQARGIGPYSDNATVTVINGGQITAKSIGGAAKNAVLSVGWTDESDFVEARLLGTITWARHFAAADSPTEYYNDTTTMASSMRLVPIEGHPGLTHVEALAPTCTEEGCVEYWLCEVCGRCYADAEGTTEIDPVLPMIDHSPVYVEAAEPDGAVAGCLAHYICESCGAFFADAACTESLARSAVLRIPYLDASDNYAVLEPGEYWMLDEYAEANHISTGVTLYSGCYVVEGDYCENYSFSVRTDNDVKLVLCDGAHFHFPTSNNYDYFTLNNGATASFYAQSTGADMGAFGVEKNRVTVTNGATLNIYGGRFTLGSTESTFGAIGCNSNDSFTGSIHIYGGEVTAMAKSASYVAIGAARGNTVEILGGTVNVIGGSISAADVRLGWTRGTDRITAAAYGGTVTFVDSFLFMDGETAEQATAENIAGRTLIPVDGFCGEHVYWNLEDGVLTISGTGAMADYTFSDHAPWYDLGVISAVIEDGVTHIGDHAFNSCTGLQSVGIGGDVTSIGSFTFYACERLTEVNIPDSVTSIGNYAFAYCRCLTEVTVPASVKTLGQHTFEYCAELTEATIGAESIGNYAFLQCSKLTTLTLLDSVKSIGWEAFESCGKLKNLNFGSGVETIGAYAFLGCGSLESVTLPASVTSLGSASFDSCTALKTVTAEGCLTIVSENTFHGCYNLETVTFAGGVKTLGDGAFSGFTQLKTVVFGEGTETIGGTAFERCSALTSVTIPGTVTSIGDGAFDRCSSLTSVTIPEAVTNIGYGMFTGCTALQSVVLGSSVENIGANAFYSCTSLESLTLPDTVTSIGNSAFSRCTNLTSLYIGESVTSIGNEAFWGCSALTSLHIPASTTSIGNNAFRDCTNLAYICSPVADGVAATYCADNNIEFRLCGLRVTLGEITGGTVTVNAPEHLTEGSTVTLNATANEHYLFESWTVTDANGEAIEVAEGGSFSMPASDVTVSASFRLVAGETGEVSWRLENGVLTISGTGAMADYANANATPWYELSFTSVVIEDGVTHVGNHAFGGFSAMTALTLGNSVESIGDRAFDSCGNLTALTIPASVTSIGDYAFVQCRGLTSLTVPATVTSIGFCAFHSCTGLTSLTVEAEVIGNCAFQRCEGLTTVTLGDNVKTIGDCAFQNCVNMETLSLGNGVESIGNQAFSYCSSLETVSVPASVTSLHGYEFELCTSLKTATFNASVETLSTTFYKCSSLETLTVGGSVQSIPSSTFKDYKNLKTVMIGGSVEMIGANAFYGCTSLTSLTVSSSAAIDTRAFSGCTALTSLTLGDGVSFISFRAFENCTTLTEVHIPASVTEIVQDAFYGCTNLAYLCSPAADGAAADYCASNNIPFRVCGLSVSLNQTAGGTIAADKTEDLLSGDTVTLSATAEEHYLFENWIVTDANGEAIEVAEDGSFTMPESRVNVSAAFRPLFGETGDVSWRYEDGVLTIYGTGTMADYTYSNRAPWNGLSITSVVIEGGVTHVGNYAFSECSGLTAVTFGDSVESIGENAFEQCAGLTGLMFPASVTSIGNSAFINCSGLTTLTIPASVKTLGSSAFYCCTGLTEATVGAETIGVAALGACSNLKTLTLLDSVKTLRSDAFLTCSKLQTVNFGTGLQRIESIAFDACAGLESITIPASVTYFGSPVFVGCANLKTVVFECSLQRASGIFDQCQNVETVIFAGGVQNVESMAFWNLSKLKSVDLGDSVETIGASAFQGCTSLENLTLGSSLKTIGSYAFFNCASLESLTLPEGLETISDHAFSYCKGLMSLHIPASVTSIGEDAFSYCTHLAYLCSPAADGAAADYCANYNIEFRVCGLSVTLDQTAGGTIAADKTEDLFSGDTVTLSAMPDGYYSFESWIVTDANGETIEVAEDGSFTMPESSVTVSATFAAPGPIIITQQPADASAPLGEIASTTVVAEGEGLTYQWYGQDPGGSVFTSGLKGDTYSVTLVSSKAGRQVWCVITDAAGNTVTTRKATLSVEPPTGYFAPRIVTEPENAKADPGETATVSFTAEGTGTLRYRWYFSNNGGVTWNRSSITTNTYAVEMNASRKGRLLYCVVSDEYGQQAETETVSLDYAIPEGYTGPSIITQPVDATADPGETVFVTVVATGQGELKYQWYFKNAGSENWTKSSTKTDTYSVEMNASRKGRSLYCVVTDKYGMSKRSETVTIDYDYPEGYETPKIIIEPADVFAGAGELASTTVTAVGEGLTYQWFLRANEDAAWSRSSLRTDTYSVAMTAGKSGRQVYCVITDRYGAKVETRVATLTMAMPEGYELRVVSQPEDCAVARGERAEATFVVEGAGLTYQWYGLDPGQTEYWTSGIRSATYSVTMVPAKSGRQVYCVVTDAYGNTVTSDTVTLSMIRSALVPSPNSPDNVFIRPAAALCADKQS